MGRIMDHQTIKQQVTEFLGGKTAFLAYVDAHRCTDTPPSPSNAVFMDFRPEGGLVVGGYEEGHWWDLDNGARFAHRPYAWVPLPPGFKEP
jgi:hypothetical protein